MNEYLPTTPFDIYELHLLQLVAKHGSFTRAGEIAGLTQSAITRQVQGMETALGIPLLERTTRRVRPTPACEFLLRETRRILADIDTALLRLREKYADAPREVRVGVSRTVSLAHLPGIFFANQRKHPEILTRVSHQSSREIIEALDSGDLDIGVITAPVKLPTSLRITHSFKDDFALIAPRPYAPPAENSRWPGWLAAHPHLLIHEDSSTGRSLREWLKQQKAAPAAAPAMQLDSFDLIIHLVALGMGVAFVPRRALATHPRKKLLQQIPLPQRFTRDLVILTRKQKSSPPHITQFVENILF